jgi:DNA-binding response OmpR family regulator
MSSQIRGDEDGASRTRVLIVEDDDGIGASLQRGLRREGYDAVRVSTGLEALNASATDVVLLDLGLPDIDGMDVCRRLRERSDAAVIVVTAREEEADRVAALDIGADDYLVKPFGFAELTARIRAVLRRRQPTQTSLIAYGSLSVDARTRAVRVGQRPVELTPKEYDILSCLASDPGRAFTRDEIVERVWDWRWHGSTKVLDVHVAALRRKLALPGLIVTVYGHGFRLGDGE